MKHLSVNNINDIKEQIARDINNTTLVAEVKSKSVMITRNVVTDDVVELNDCNFYCEFEVIPTEYNDEEGYAYAKVTNCYVTDKNDKQIACDNLNEVIKVIEDLCEPCEYEVEDYEELKHFYEEEYGFGRRYAI